MYWLIGIIIWGLLWGAVCKSVMTNKGYDDETGNKWFAIGFLIDIFAFLIVITKPDNPYKEIKQNMGIKQPGQNNYGSSEWRCICGNINDGSETHCTRCNSRRPEQKNDPNGNGWR